MTQPASEAVPGDGGRDEASSAEPDQLSSVLEVLGDGTSRRLLWLLGEAGGALTARELADICDASLTSVYRKLDRLTEAGLVEEDAEVDPDGHRRSRYRPVVDQIEIGLGADDGVEVRLYQGATTLRLPAE